jgi:hypothetical protein
MRIISRRGSAEFLLKENINTKRGVLGKGLYNVNNHKITRYQDFEKKISIKRLNWNNISLDRLRADNNITKIWEQQLMRMVNKYK